MAMYVFKDIDRKEKLLARNSKKRRQESALLLPKSGL
jgi:hypothetical protein